LPCSLYSKSEQVLCRIILARVLLEQEHGKRCTIADRGPIDPESKGRFAAFCVQVSARPRWPFSIGTRVRRNIASQAPWSAIFAPSCGPISPLGSSRGKPSSEEALS